MAGTVVALGTADAEGAPMRAQPTLRVEPVKGVLGDRYSDARGHFQGHPDQEVTLVEAEDAEAVGLDPLALRRNVVTRGIRLDEMVGRALRVGGATLHGMRPCLPCGYLARHTGRAGLRTELRGGLRARVVHAGDIRVGDAVEPVAPTLDADMRAVVESAHLAFVATLTADGRPNLSPKGTIRVLDDRRLFYLDIASRQTRKNLATSPWMEVNVVDTTSRRGYRFYGQAAVHVDDELARAATARVFEEDGATYRTEAVVVLELERVLPLVSPGYANVPDEWTMRAAWKAKRAALDEAFESHLRDTHSRQR